LEIIAARAAILSSELVTVFPLRTLGRHSLYKATLAHYVAVLLSVVRPVRAQDGAIVGHSARSDRAHANLSSSGCSQYSYCGATSGEQFTIA
jgi:hypothetical protein